MLTMTAHGRGRTGVGFAFLATIVLVGLMTSGFALWSLTCLGGAACNVMQVII